MPAKPVEKPLTHIDKDTVGKVVGLKEKYQKMRDRQKEKERQLHILDMKIDALAERIRDIDKKKSEFKNQLFEEKKKNHLLRKKLEINEQEKLDLEQQLETGIKPTHKGKRGKGVRNVNLEDHQQMLEEKRRKEREEMRRQLFAGIDFLGGGQLKISQSENRSWYAILKEKFYKFMDVITPHRDDVKFVSTKYDRAIEGFFQFFRFLVSFSLVMCIVFLTLLAIHSVYYWNSNFSISKYPDTCYYIP